MSTLRSLKSPQHTTGSLPMKNLMRIVATTGLEPVNALTLSYAASLRSDELTLLHSDELLSFYLAGNPTWLNAYCISTVFLAKYYDSVLHLHVVVASPLCRLSIRNLSHGYANSFLSGSSRRYLYSRQSSWKNTDKH